MKNKERKEQQNIGDGNVYKATSNIDNRNDGKHAMTTTAQESKEKFNKPETSILNGKRQMEKGDNIIKTDVKNE